MTTITATEARNNIGKLWSRAAGEPVTVLSAGQAVAVVLSPAEFARLTAKQHGVKAGFAKHLFEGIDVDALLDTDISEVFEEYQ